MFKVNQEYVKHHVGRKVDADQCVFKPEPAHLKKNNAQLQTTVLMLCMNDSMECDSQETPQNGNTSFKELIPTNLLCGYQMQWALDSVLYVTNLQQSAFVSAYKMATKSWAFRELLYAMRFEENKNNQSIDAQESVVNKQEQLLITYDENHTGLEDLLLALHFCHVANCQLNGIMRIADPGFKNYPCDDAREESAIYRTPQICINKHDSICCLAAGLRIAGLYGLRELSHACYDYTKAVIDDSNCWQLWAMATTSSNELMDNLRTKDLTFFNIVREYISINFTRIMGIPNGIPASNFEDLNVNQLEFILKSTKLNVQQEKDVVSAIKTWLNSEKRTQVECEESATRLISNCVRIKHLELEDIEYLYNIPSLRTKRKALKRSKLAALPPRILTPKRRTRMKMEYMTRIRQVRRRLFRMDRNLRPLGTTDIDSGASTKWENNEPQEHRLPHEAIFVFGGWKGFGPCRDVCVFDARRKTWVHYSPQEDGSEAPILLPVALMSFGIAIVKNRYIIIAGGEDSTACTTSSVMGFDAKLNSLSLGDRSKGGWKTLPSLQEKRRDLVLVRVQDRQLYAIGGDNNCTVLNVVERLDLGDLHELHTQTGWTKMQSMLVARAAAAADAVHDVIYVCGGYTESHMEALTNTCEAYCTRTNQWTFIQPMAQPRYYGQAVTVDGVLFVLGGGGENGIRGGGATRTVPSAGYSSTVERYDPRTTIWELMPPMSERADFAACLFEDKLVCLGGGGEALCIADVECWKPWTPDTQTQVLREAGSNHTGPVWLHPGPQSSRTSDHSWRKYVNLPHATWGHRCVVLKGWDLITPYLRRRVPVHLHDQEENQIQVEETIGRPVIKDKMYVLCVPGHVDEEAKR